MDIYDIILTPIYLIIFYAIAYGIRPKYTTNENRKYFIPALTVKFIGAISLGLIYQFYYGGGDTFHYYDQIAVLYKSFIDSPKIWLRIMLSDGEFNSETYKYTSQLIWYRSSTEFIIIKLGSLFSLFSFNTYSIIGLFFAFSSFTGLWALYNALLKIKGDLKRQFAISVFFLPSVFFWGSGLMKDSITLGALGWLFYGFYDLFIKQKNKFRNIVIILISSYLLIEIKIYILLSFLPPALFWLFLEYNQIIRNSKIRLLLKPLFIGIGLIIAFAGTSTLTAGDERYDLEKIGERTKLNSEYLSEFVKSGSAYKLGTFDGTLGSMIRVGPQAVFIALYRPFIWEARSITMLLSSFEAIFFIYLTLTLIFRIGPIKVIKHILNNPSVNFCILFSVLFAFGVGTNSGNFGTLVRYKIPLMPFYLAALFIIQSIDKKSRISKTNAKHLLKL